MVQPNLLTSFKRPGPYNIQLLARHMDALLQIPTFFRTRLCITALDLIVIPIQTPSQSFMSLSTSS